MSDEENKVDETKETNEKAKEVAADAKEVKKEVVEVAKVVEEVGEKSDVGAGSTNSQEPEKTMEEERQEKAEEEIIPVADKKAKAVELPNQDLRSGMLVRVHEKIKDVNAKGEERERVQVFEGLIIGTKSKGISRTMTVRKNANGWMVEKIYPLASPNIEKVEIIKQFRTRRAKLSYLRGKFKRKLREIKEEK